MGIVAIFKFILAAMFSPPGIANFVVCMFLKQRWQATVAAIIASGAYLFFTSAVLSKLDPANFTIAVVASVVGMMVASHVSFTIGEKLIRKNK